MRDSHDASTNKALDEGAQRSIEASRRPVQEHPAARLWRRHKWKIIALLLFGLLDLVLLEGGYIGGHF